MSRKKVDVESPEARLRHDRINTVTALSLLAQLLSRATDPKEQEKEKFRKVGDLRLGA